MQSKICFGAITVLFSILICAKSQSIEKIHRSSCRRDVLMKATDRDKKLNGTAQNIILEIHAEKLSLCAKRCTGAEKCMTINYKKFPASLQGNNCQLLDISKANQSVSLTNASGWIHYEPVAQASPRCRLVNCSVGYACVETCSVLKGYNCIEIDECASDPCRNGATCINGINKFTCTCLPGYTGNLCQSDLNECVSQPCQHGGTCVDAVNQFSCNCVPGYVGSLCQTDYNECSSNPCQNGATCHDKKASYSCTCREGYSGTYCSERLASRYTIDLTSVDWYKARENCQRIGRDLVIINSASEYEFIKSLTSSHSTRSFWIGFSDMTARGGFGWIDDSSPSFLQWATGEPQGDNERCVEMRIERDWNNIVCSYSMAFICEVVDIPYGLVTEKKTWLDAKNTCSQWGKELAVIQTETEQNIIHGIVSPYASDMIWIGLHDIGHEGTFVWVDGSSPGYTKWIIDNPDNYNGNENCVELVEVDRARGWNDQNCDQLTNAVCEDIDECKSNPCQNSGSCSNHVNRYTCNCLAGYSGINCETDVNECASLPCQNGGQCVDHVDRFSCNCPPDFDGSLCQLGNIAKGKQTGQSSRSDSHLVVDGNAASNYGDGSCSHTDSQYQPWWRVDLDATYSIGTVKITNRGDCCATRLSNFYVYVGDDTENIHANSQCFFYSGYPSAGSTVTLSCTSAVSGRFVFVILRDTGLLTLCEVRVFVKE